MVVLKEMSYSIPFASGNTATSCDTIGFLIHHFAVSGSVCYKNGSICFYYLAIISTYNKKYDYIRRKLEPWFHRISILFPLIFSDILLAMGQREGFVFQNHITRRIALDTKRQIFQKKDIAFHVGGVAQAYGGHAELRQKSLFVQWLYVLIITPESILVTMATMFRSVSNIETRMQKYAGVSALRFRTTLVVL